MGWAYRMRRQPEDLVNVKFDALVIGGGIYGACVARDAALRGLRVALVERGDFGGGTSFNSLKIIHGGFRYLQQLDFRRLRESVRERRYWLWAAPHLVRPLQFMIPTHGRTTRSPAALRAAAALYNLLSADRNRGLAALQRIPGGRTLPSEALQETMPGLAAGNSGAAEWYDAQVVDTEHLLLACLRDAVAAGATIANYVDAKSLLGGSLAVTGARCADRVTGSEFDVRARVVVETTGPFTGNFSGQGTMPDHAQVKSINLLVPRLGAAGAFGINAPSRSNSQATKRLLFTTPWRGFSLIGTTHEVHTGRAEDCRLSEEDIACFLADINAAIPGADLTLNDVLWAYCGLIPAEDNGGGSRRTSGARRGRLADHAMNSGQAGLISVVGEKYTTARAMAERVTDRVLEHLRFSPRPCLVATRQLPGAPPEGGIGWLAEDFHRHVRQPLTPPFQELLESYGTAYSDVLGIAEYESLGESSPPAHELYRRRSLYGIRHEMAIHLDDLVLRRTDLAVRGLLPDALVDWTADLMAAEHAWSPQRRELEIARVRRQLRGNGTAPDITGADGHCNAQLLRDAVTSGVGEPARGVG